MHRNMLRAFGLALLAALGLMAFAAAGAHAEELTGTLGKVRILGLENLSAGVTGVQIGAGTLLIPALNTEIVCEKVDVLNGSVSNDGPHGLGLGEVLYLECVYWSTKTTKHVSGVELLELKEKLPCEILEEGTLAKGAIVAKARLLVILHKNPNNPSEVADTYVLVEPDVIPLKPTDPLAGVLTTTPSECPLPKLVSVTGTTVFKVTLGDLNLGQPEEVYVDIESSKAIAKLFSDKLLFGINEAFIDGKALLSLTGPHLGCKWGLI